MILILTRADIRQEFHHLKAEEITTRHTHLDASPSGAMAYAAGHAEGVVFMDSDLSVHVIKSRCEEKSYPTIMEFIGNMEFWDRPRF